jgi:predicted amidohydrolase
VRLALAQVDCVLGDLDANLRTASRVIADAAEAGAELVVFPELNLTGYAVGALGSDSSMRAHDERLRALAEQAPGVAVVVGFHEDGGLHTYNAAAYLEAGSVRHVHRKLYLPTYDVFEERKHFSPGQSLRAFDTLHGRMALLTCNDAWQPVLPFIAVHDGAEVLLVPTNSSDMRSPDFLDTQVYWRDLVAQMGRMLQSWVVFVNRVGEEAGFRFWGGSCVIDPSGAVIGQAPIAEEALIVLDVDVPEARRRRRRLPLLKEARLGLLVRELERLRSEGGDA